MSEKDFQRIIKSIESDAMPPQGLKERMLEQILFQEDNDCNPAVSKIERLIFERPLRTAFMISSAISVILWIAMGDGYTSSLSYLIGIR